MPCWALRKPNRKRWHEQRQRKDPQGRRAAQARPSQRLHHRRLRGGGGARGDARAADRRGAREHSLCLAERAGRRIPGACRPCRRRYRARSDRQGCRRRPRCHQWRPPHRPGALPAVGCRTDRAQGWSRGRLGHQGRTRPGSRRTGHQSGSAPQHRRQRARGGGRTARPGRSGGHHLRPRRRRDGQENLERPPRHPRRHFHPRHDRYRPPLFDRCFPRQRRASRRRRLETGADEHRFHHRRT